MEADTQEVEADINNKVDIKVDIKVDKGATEVVRLDIKVAEVVILREASLDIKVAVIKLVCVSWHARLQMPNLVRFRRRIWRWRIQPTRPRWRWLLDSLMSLIVFEVRSPAHPLGIYCNNILQQPSLFSGSLKASFELYL